MIAHFLEMVPMVLLLGANYLLFNSLTQVYIFQTNVKKQIIAMIKPEMKEKLGVNQDMPPIMYQKQGNLVNIMNVWFLAQRLY